MEHKRPTFDDKNETVSDPLHEPAVLGAGVGSGDPAGTAVPQQCDKPPIGWICTREKGHEGPCAALPEAELKAGPDGDSRPTTEEEQQQGAAVLFDATKRRMVILLNTLVKLAESGDFALWCPLAAMDETFRGLDWTSVPPLAVAKFYKLVAMTLTSYGTRLDEHAMAVLESVRDQKPLPEVPVWAADDTLRMYDMVEQIFAPPNPMEVPEEKKIGGEQ